jgi:predicted transposase/invertase (TIGR01784 family)
MNYEREMKYFSDNVNALAYAKKKGITQGILQTAKSMLKDGLSLMRVARITKLSREEILALR